jgi:S-adenosylmethionine:tRNA ribosyltransferase-isomerase
MHSAEFSYDLPPEAIAQEAIEPRDAARLLVARTLEDRSFTDLPDLLDPGDLVVVNNTRVRPARVYATKKTDGRVELLLTKRVTATTWEALVRPARRIRPGSELTVGPLTMVVVTEPDRGVVILEVSPARSVDEVLRELGEVPLPPYFHGTLDDDERYQTIFARAVGSAAAPTAALHFTPRVVGALHARNVGIVDVELEVGLDSFRPMKDGPISDHEMHEERYMVPVATADAIAETKLRESRVVAVGTTVVRTLETAAESDGAVQPGSGSTELFITPGFRTKVVDAVVTNFHAPGTTLIVMIAALIGSTWREVYAHALGSGYRFLSFGDAMFIEVDQ